MTDLPRELYDDPLIRQKLRVLDLSKNKLSSTTSTLLSHKLGLLQELKTLCLDDNQLSCCHPTNVLRGITQLKQLQNLSLAHNLLGKPPTATKNPILHKKNAAPKHRPSNSTNTNLIEQLEQTKITDDTNNAFPILPVSLKQLNLSFNYFSSIPSAIVSDTLVKLEKLDLSNNQLATLPDSISNLGNLEELKLDHNQMIVLPDAVGKLSKLKALSLRHNQIQVLDTTTATTNGTVITASSYYKEQPIPAEVFSQTKLIDLNLHGNVHLTNTQLNRFLGYDDYLNRRQKIKSKLLTNLDTCGLE